MADDHRPQLTGDAHVSELSGRLELALEGGWQHEILSMDHLAVFYRRLRRGGADGQPRGGPSGE